MLQRVKDLEADPTYVQLPHAASENAQGMCGFLRVHMYATRAAADGWHCEYSSFLKELGSAMGDASACVLRHVRRGLVTSVRGDDFTTFGPKHNLDWIKFQMERCYELKTKLAWGQPPETTRS